MAICPPTIVEIPLDRDAGCNPYTSPSRPPLLVSPFSPRQPEAASISCLLLCPLNPPDGDFLLSQLPAPMTAPSPQGFFMVQHLRLSWPGVVVGATGRQTCLRTRHEGRRQALLRSLQLARFVSPADGLERCPYARACPLSRSSPSSAPRRCSRKIWLPPRTAEAGVWGGMWAL